MSTYLNCNRKINPIFLLADCRPNLMPFFMEADSGSVKYFLASMKCYSNQKFYYCTFLLHFSLSARLHLIFKFRAKTESIRIWFWFYSHIRKLLKSLPRICWYNLQKKNNFFKGKIKYGHFPFFYTHIWTGQFEE